MMKEIPFKMINEKKILAIIPARGGSKGLVRKNILLLGNIPLIAWTINAAKNSKYIDRAIVSTDDNEISNIAKKYECEVPFIRPAELASDTAESASVVVHALNTIDSSFDIIILLQPTSPFRGAGIIDAALEQFIQTKVKSLVSVTALNKSPEYLFYLNTRNKRLSKILTSRHKVTRRQDSNPAYYLNGALYIFDRNYFLQNRCFIDKYTEAFVMEAQNSLDIDSKEDFNYAKFMLQISDLE